MSHKISKALLGSSIMAILAAVACLSIVPSTVLAQVNDTSTTQDDPSSNATPDPASDSSQQHVADGAVTLQGGETKVLPFNLDSNSSTSAFITGHVSVEGGVAWIRITDSQGTSQSADGVTQVAVYSKDTPMSDYDNGNFKSVKIPIRDGMEQVVLFSPSTVPSTITYDLDITQSPADASQP